MKRWQLAVLVSTVLLATALPAAAADFGWLNDFSIQAQADPSGFRARLATRFKIGDAEISAVVGNLPDPADAYMVLRLGELARRPPEEVIDLYKANKGKGWGVMAKELGIKPGSREFQALKKGHDLGDDFGRGKNAPKGKDKGKGKDRDRGR